MKKRDILIIIILTVILIIALITTIQKKPEIENIYLSSDKDSTFDQLQLSSDYNFNSDNSNIYLLMKIKNLTVDHEIKVEWEKTEDDNIYHTIQKDIFSPEQNGSGKIVVLLIKKGDTYTPGDYKVTVYLNGEDKISKKFYINSLY